MRIYYSHPKWMYNTKEEEDALKVIGRFFSGDVEILNPRDYDEDPDFAEIKRREGLTICFKLIDQTDCVVFQRFKLTEQLRNFILDYLEAADEYGDYRSHLKQDLRGVPEGLERLVTEKDSVVTPGVAKEVNYALKVKKKVYELKETMLQPQSENTKSDFKGPRDPLYRTLSLMIRAWRDNRPSPLYPYFWWLMDT